VSTVREHRLTPGWIRRLDRRPAVLATASAPSAAVTPEPPGKPSAGLSVTLNNAALITVKVG
jgi:hypothetical protein